MKEELDKLEQFFLQFKRINYKKNGLIVRADDIPSGVYYIHKGYIKLYTLSEAGQELTLIIFKPRDFFPVIWAINDSPNTQYCEAITAVELSRAPKEEFLRYINDNPDVLLGVLSKVLTRFEGLLERMGYIIFGDAHQKVASILVICAERFGLKKGNKILIMVPLTHKDIANLIGLTRETTSVELKKLEKLNVCIKEGRFFTVKNLDKLRSEAKWSKFV